MTGPSGLMILDRGTITTRDHVVDAADTQGTHAPMTMLPMSEPHSVQRRAGDDGESS